MPEFTQSPIFPSPLHVQNVSVKRHEKVIIRSISLELSAGERLFLVGPNGAGKTTFCRAICGLIPISGSIHLLGQPVHGGTNREKRMSQIGVLIEQPGILANLTCEQWLTHHAKLHRVNNPLEASQSYLDDWEIPRRAKTEELSLGQRQRLQILRTLIHDPKFLIWDEPTATLDPSAQAWLWRKIQKWQSASKATSIICTHHLEEAFAYGDRIAVLSQGQLRALGTPDSIITSPPSSRKIRISPTACISNVCDTIQSAIPESKIQIISSDLFRLTTPRGEMDHPQIFNCLLPAGIPIYTIERDATTLREVWEEVITSPPLDVPLPEFLKPAEETFLPIIKQRTVHPFVAWTNTFTLHLSIFSREKKILIPLIFLESFYFLSLAVATPTQLTASSLMSLISMASLLPIGLGSSLAADSVAGERERKSLEVMLTQPISYQIIILGKLTSIFIPTIFLSWIASILSISILIQKNADISIAALSGFLLIFLPSALLFSTACVTWTSMKSRTVRSAAQVGGLLLMPLMGVTQWLSIGSGSIHGYPWVYAGFLLLTLASITMMITFLRTKPETILDPSI